MKGWLIFHCKISECTQAPGMCFWAKPLPALATGCRRNGPGRSAEGAPGERGRTAVSVRPSAPSQPCVSLLPRTGAPQGPAPQAGCSRSPHPACVQCAAGKWPLLALLHVVGGNTVVRLVQGCGVTSLEVVPNGSSMTFSCVSSCLGAAPRLG